MSGVWPRRVPPAWTPLSFASILHAAVDALGEDPRARLREFLAKRYRADEVVLVDSGTHALELAIRTAHAAIAGRGTVGTALPLTVALPAYSCFDLATAAIGAKARVELYDVEPGTLGPDLDSLEAALGAGANVVVVAPLYGVPVDWDSCSAIAARHGAVLIEDAAQGQGASWRGAPLGTLGELSVLSFGRGKGWTGGSGGALLLRERMAGRWPRDAVARGAAYGGEGLVLAAAQHVLSRPSLFGIASAIPALHVGETVYHAPSAICAMSSSAAALLLRTASLVEREAEQRRINGATIRAAFAARAVGAAEYPAAVVAPPEGNPGNLRFPCLAAGAAKSPFPADARRLGMGSPYPITLAQLEPLQPALTERSRTARFAGAEAIVQRLVTLPTHSLAADADRRALVGILLGGSR